MYGLLILLLVVAVSGTAGGAGWSRLSREHKEAKSLPLNAANFNKLNDGVYHGAYAGGMYKWRANECDVTVSSGRVTDIQLVVSQDPGGKNTQHEALFDRVIQAQTLQVDTISGATLTSKAYLQAVENALVQAQHEQKSASGGAWKLPIIFCLQEELK
jgi:uncharacterized protein with FMN-binding domain